MTKKSRGYKVLSIIGGAAAIILVLNIFINYKTDSVEEVQYQTEFSKNYTVYAVPIPDHMSFAGENVPLELIDVRESLDHELIINTYYQSSTLLMIKRAHKFFPLIESILKEEGLHDDFKYLAVAESGLKDVVSPAGAAGFWQFMKSSGKEYGLEINNEVDERYHLEKATRAACKYLKNSYSTYNSWSLAAASYNMGVGGLNSQISKQKEKTYFDLYLNSETARYVYRILALKLILENPENFGFHFREKDLYNAIECREIKVDSTITDLVDFAQQNGTNYKMLKNLNPWLRSNSLYNKSATSYTILVPADNARIYEPLKDSIKSESIAKDTTQN